MSLSGTTNTYLLPTLDGLNVIEADAVIINGVPVDVDNLVPYTGATKNVSLNTKNFQTLGTVTASQYTIASVTSTIASTVYTSDTWGLYNGITLSSLVSTSHLTLKDSTNGSTLLTFQSDGVANFASSFIRTYNDPIEKSDVINLAYLSSAVAYIENGTSLTYVPYTNPFQSLNMGQSSILTSGLMSAGHIRITSSVANDDYALSINAYNQLEIINLTTSSMVKISSGDVHANRVFLSDTIYSVDSQLSGSQYLMYGTPFQWSASVPVSSYDIQDDLGKTHFSLNKTGLTISTLTLKAVSSASPSFALGINGGGQVVSFAVPTGTNYLSTANTWTNANTFNSSVYLPNVSSMTPSYALGVNGGGQVVSFAVPTGTNYLSSANTWIGTNTFNSTLTAGAGYTTNLNSALVTQLNSVGFSSASFTTTGITGSYSPPLGTLTNVSGSTYQIAQTANGQSVMAISGFSPIVGTTYYFNINIKCTVGTATMYVEQNNSLRSPTAYQLSTSFQVINGSFYFDGTANTIIFRIYTGTASWNAQWDSFTLSTYSVLVSAPLTLNTLATSRALITDGSKNVSTSITTSTELGYLSGVSSAIQPQFSTLQGQFGNYLPLTGGTLTGHFSTIQSTNISLQGGAWNLNLQPTTTSLLQTAGLSAQSAPGVISGSYTLTPSPTTAPTMGMYSPSQTFIAGARYTARFTSFLASAFGMSLRIYQANTANTATLLISTSTATVIGTFEVEFFPNSNPSYLGQVYLEFSGSSNKTVSWTAFTYTISTATVNGNEIVNGNLTVNGTTTTIGNRFLGSMDGSNHFWTGLKGTGTESNRLGIGIVGNVSTGIVNGIVMNVGGTRQLNLNSDGKVYLERNEVVVNGTLNSGAGFYGQYRMVQGNYGVFFRNDGTATYMPLITNSGDPYGQWNTLRPLRIDNASGQITMENNPWVNATQNMYPIVVNSSGNLFKSQCSAYRIYNQNSASWGGGYAFDYSIYKVNNNTTVKISGKLSYYVGGATRAYPYLRIYSTASGVYRYFSFEAFTNNGGNHVTFPIELILDPSQLPEYGWFHMYWYNNGSCQTDYNDQFWLHTTMYPTSYLT